MYSAIHCVPLTLQCQSLMTDWMGADSYNGAELLQKLALRKTFHSFPNMTFAYKQLRHISCVFITKTNSVCRNCNPSPLMGALLENQSKAHKKYVLYQSDGLKKTSLIFNWYKEVNGTFSFRNKNAMHVYQRTVTDHGYHMAQCAEVKGQDLIRLLYKPAGDRIHNYTQAYFTNRRKQSFSWYMTTFISSLQYSTLTISN